MNTQCYNCGDLYNSSDNDSNGCLCINNPKYVTCIDCKEIKNITMMSYINKLQCFTCWVKSRINNNINNNSIINNNVINDDIINNIESQCYNCGKIYFTNEQNSTYNTCGINCASYKYAVCIICNESKIAALMSHNDNSQCFTCWMKLQIKNNKAIKK